MLTLRGKFLLVAALLLPVAGSVWAAGEETRPITPYDVLWLSKADSDVALLQERVGRIQDRANWYVQEMARRDGTVGWQLDLPNQRWVKPPEEKLPNPTQEER